jgi:4-coumarate--CoA ligase
LLAKVLDVACALVDLHNFQTGDSVFQVCDHTDTAFIVALGAIVAGGFVGAANPKDPYDELLASAKQIRPTFVSCQANNAQLVGSLSNDLGYRVKVIEMDSSSLDELLSYEHNKSAALSWLPVACADKRRHLVCVTFSSGTSGRPKPVPQTLLASLTELYSYQSLFSKDRNGALGTCTSFTHASGRLTLFSALGVGFNCVLMNGFNANTYLAAIQKYKFSAIMIGAAAFYSLMSCPQLEQYDLSSVRAVHPIGTRITYVEELKTFMAQYRNIEKIRTAFGATEMGVVTRHIERTLEHFLRDPDDCGPLAAGRQAKLVDSETGRSLLEPKERGLLLLKGVSVFPGYYDANKTDKFVCDESIFDSDGFYKTGDIVFFDEHDHLHYVGRFKETIVCRTMLKHQPHQFEEVVLRHPAVREAYVIGVDSKREKCTQCPRVFVTLRPDYEFTSQTDGHVEPPDESIDGEPLVFKGTNRLCTRIPDEMRRRLAREILHFANSRLDWIKQLMGGIVLLDEIPTLKGSGKVDKRYLHSLTLDQVEIYGDLSE